MMQGLFVFLGAIGGGAIAALANVWANRGKTAAEEEKIDAEAAEIISTTATNLLDRVMHQSDITEHKLLTEMKALEAKVDLMTAVIESLVEQLNDHGIEPVLPAAWHKL